MAKNFSYSKNEAMLHATGKTQGLGSRLRQLRKERDLTLQELAGAAGVSAGFLSQIERDISSPSLLTLNALAEALGAHITDFFDPPPHPVEFSRQGQRVTFRVADGGIDYERLSTTFPSSTLTTMLVHYPPGRTIESMRHSGEELYFVLSGSLAISIDGAETVLNEGDSVHFDSRRLHATRNHTDLPASVIICNTTDVFHDDHAQGPPDHDPRTGD